jgi:hypothetical protein
MKHNAGDRVVPKRALPKEFVLETVDVRNGNVTLLDIAIAAAVVRSHDKDYHLLKGQCYWYSDMVMRVLAEIKNFDVNRSTSKPEDDKWIQGEVSNKSGTWYNMKVYGVNEAREAHVKVLAEKFRQKHDEVRAEVCNMNTALL